MREPTKTIAYWHETFVEVKNPHKENEVVRFYFDPPQRTWEGLTDDEIGDEYVRFEIQSGFNRFEYAVKALQAKIKEKNT